MKLNIKKSIIDGFNAIKGNPIIIFVGVLYVILVKLLEPKNLSTFSDGNIPLGISDILISYGGLNLVAIILLSIIFNGLMIVLVAKGKKASLMTAINQIASKAVVLTLASIFSFTIIVLGFVALIIPGIFLSIKLIFFEQAILLNNKGILESLKTSWNVTRGNWWGIFGLIILLSIISVAITISLNLFSRTISDFISGAIIGPILVAAYTRSYLQLKR